MVMLLTFSRATSKFCTMRYFIERARLQFCTISKNGRLAQALYYDFGEMLVIFSRLVLCWLSEKPIAPPIVCAPQSTVGRRKCYFLCSKQMIILHSEAILVPNDRLGRLQHTFIQQSKVRLKAMPTGRNKTRRVNDMIINM